MDTTALLQKIYDCYREKRLGDAMALLADDFQFKTNITEDPIDPLRPRSRAELTLLAHKFFEEFDIVTFTPAAVDVTDGAATARLEATFRHKKSGRTIDTTFHHDWRFADGKVSELRQTQDDDRWTAFQKSLADSS
jgi:ketosteroid isomerase-like protein